MLTALIHVTLAVGMAIGLIVDSRTILGINPWVKPLKFAVSISIYLVTIALFLSYLTNNNRVLIPISYTIAGTMLIEIILISLQSLRGTTSHFNNATPFDSVVFSIMGVAVAINTVALVVVLILFFRDVPTLTPAYAWGIRLGLIVFLAASMQGFLIASRLSHSVGGTDGGPGLPFVNWSTQHGDLRIAHFVGLHALQIIPFAGYVASGGNDFERSTAWSMVAVFAVAGLIVGLFVWVWWQAAKASPLIPLP